MYYNFSEGVIASCEFLRKKNAYSIFGCGDDGLKNGMVDAFVADRLEYWSAVTI